MEEKRKEFIERVIIFQILEERFYRHSRARKNRSTAENFGVNGDERVSRHAGSITDSGVRVNIAEISRTDRKSSFRQDAAATGAKRRPGFQTRSPRRPLQRLDTARRLQCYVFA